MFQALRIWKNCADSTTAIPSTGIYLQAADGRGLDARAQSAAWATRRTDPGVAHRGSERWMFPSQRYAWIPPHCKHAARSVGGAAGLMVDLSPEICRGLPRTPCMFSSSELLFAIVHRMAGWDLRQPLNTAQKHLVTTLRDEIRQPDRQPLRLTLPREERLARVADALMEDVADDRTLDAWANVAGMSRRTFMRTFSAEAG